MGYRLPRCFACAIAVMAAMALAHMPAPLAAQQPLVEDEVLSFVEGLQNGTLPPALASEDCRRQMEQDPGIADFLQVMATYLEVPEAMALSAFCTALVRAVRAGDLTAGGLAVVARQKMDAAMLLEVGRILRAVHFSHRLTTTASAAGDTP
ncbi:MAG: hypothetical protein ACFCUT_02525 [Kiloniellaceae bacterium]